MYVGLHAATCYVVDVFFLLGGSKNDLPDAGGNFRFVLISTKVIIFIRKCVTDYAAVKKSASLYDSVLV